MFALRLDRLLPALFVLFALPLTLFVAFAAPPGQAPDETAHAIRAASLLEWQFVGFRMPAALVNGIWQEQVDVHANLGTPDVVSQGPGVGTSYPAARPALQSIPWTRGAPPVGVPNTAVYPPFLYIPAALALGAMQATGHSPFQAFLAERVADALVYALLGGLALGLARRGRLLLFTALLMPTAIWLGGMLHPDGLMIGLCALAAALLTDAEAQPRRLWFAAGALALVIMARPPLIPLALFLLIPFGRAGWRRAIGPFLLAALPGIAWAAIVVPKLSVPFYVTNGPGGPLWHGNPTRIFHSTNSGIQAHILLGHPGLLLTLPLATLLDEWNVKVSELFRVVGALSLPLPRVVEWVTLAAFAGAIASFGRHAPYRRLIAWGLIAAATVLLIYDAEYISWTQVGADRVQGVQGRYFLELLPFLALAGSRREPWPGFYLAPLALAVCSAVVLPLAVMRAYYS